MKNINIGDLATGVVTNIKSAEAFDSSENVRDIKVYWNDGEEFWCLDVTLKVLSKNENYQTSVLVIG